MCDLEADDTVTSISWATTGSNISVGTNSGMFSLLSGVFVVFVIAGYFWWTRMLIQNVRFSFVNPLYSIVLLS